ncbi:arsenate reductase [Methylobacterium terrae]|uniref:Arsenate reductase n=1 Tax=Methylobacterium terrae TaxID=2202827 RepID=A0A2U8WKQ9_9HYPH|nr:ArsC/Spx/MgsR family protein [Methylobacterium terrae]AWN46834.1 arsenate reductase [Methylobacterium terrae]
MDVVIDHNPACGTARSVLAMIREAGIGPRVVESLKTPPTLAQPGRRLDQVGLADASLPGDRLLAALAACPVRLDRPLVASPRGVRLCRPAERMPDLSPSQGSEPAR